MTPPARHRTQTRLEAAVCEEMVRQELAHEHRSLQFRVQEADGSLAKYAPAIVARRGSILFLIEPIDSVTPAMIHRFTGFLEQHSPELVFVIVVPDARVPELPADAYDEIYPESDLVRMTDRIRKQDPRGIVPPFPKPAPPTGREREAAKEPDRPPTS